MLITTSLSFFLFVIFLLLGVVSLARGKRGASIDTEARSHIVLDLVEVTLLFFSRDCFVRLYSFSTHSLFFESLSIFSLSALRFSLESWRRIFFLHLLAPLRVARSLTLCSRLHSVTLFALYPYTLDYLSYLIILIIPLALRFCFFPHVVGSPATRGRIGWFFRIFADLVLSFCF